MLFVLTLLSFLPPYSPGSCYGRGERAWPPACRATDCHVLWPTAPTHELTDRQVGA